MHEVRDLVTSRDAHWSATDLLALVGGLWPLETRVPSVRLVPLAGDATPTRGGAAPRVRAPLRNPVLGFLHCRRWRNLAAAVRHYAWHPASHVLRLLGINR